MSTLARDDLDRLLEEFPIARECVRKGAIRIAFRRAFLVVAQQVRDMVKRQGGRKPTGVLLSVEAMNQRKRSMKISSISRRKDHRTASCSTRSTRSRGRRGAGLVHRAAEGRAAAAWRCSEIVEQLAQGQSAAAAAAATAATATAAAAALAAAGRARSPPEVRKKHHHHAGANGSPRSPEGAGHRRRRCRRRRGGSA